LQRERCDRETKLALHLRRATGFKHSQPPSGFVSMSWEQSETVGNGTHNPVISVTKP
jgi:hypothetical protein